MVSSETSARRSFNRENEHTRGIRGIKICCFKGQRGYIPKDNREKIRIERDPNK